MRKSRRVPNKKRSLRGNISIPGNIIMNLKKKKIIIIIIIDKEKKMEEIFLSIK